ncbi:hypothetical protein [Tepidiphilus margaritifer]|uniref:hypothetical protein n=1 Tax=Tepidiphilus margaritifer TaxID=203471 RepID=UPI0003FCD039|nr:hypothetical protein [Tepidiphilus margaritifer]
MSAIQSAVAGTAAASFVASQIGNSIAGTFGMGYAKLVVGQAAWAASVGVIGEKMANGTATGGDYAKVIQKTGDLLLGLGLTIAQVNPWVRGAFTIVSGGLFISNNWDKISDFYDRAKTWVWPRDPIILDLDGDGLETIGLTANIYFDFDADGVLTKTGWAGKDDALLVWDKNGNGRIDSGAELFGDFTVLPNGTLAPNGFAALAALDANGDGILDASDPAFAELKLWRDTDQDGVTGSGELISLLDAGIVILDLAHTLKNQRLSNGNTLSREGRFTRADGSTSAMGEFKLATDTFDTRFAEAIDVPGTLKSQTDGANCGLSISAGPGGGSGDAAMALAALPTLLVNYSQPQLDLLQQAYDSLKERVYANLVLQTRLKPYLDAIELVIDEQGLRLDATRLNQTLAAKKAADPENYLADLLDEFKVHTLTGGDDYAYLTENADIVLSKNLRYRDGETANGDWRLAA